MQPSAGDAADTGIRDPLSPAIAARLEELSRESESMETDGEVVSDIQSADLTADRWPPLLNDSERPVRPEPDMIGLPASPASASIRHPGELHPEMITPANFQYQGAFRLPHLEQNGTMFSYGGWALAWNPRGDVAGKADGYPGSLFITGHVEQQMVAEISIPAPRITHADSLDELPVATVIQPFADCTGGIIAQMNQTSNTPFQIGGLLVKNNLLHWTMYKYYNVDGVDFSSHGTCSLDLSAPVVDGPWHLGPINSGSPEWHSYKHAGYIFDVPAYTAEHWLNGFDLISGLQISTGLQRSSQGPAFFAYQLPPAGTPPETSLTARPLTWYSEQSPLSGHHPADRWTGSVWLELGSKQAVISVGRKSLGAFYYGNARPGDCNQDYGYHGTPYEVQMLFYSPASLIHAAHGQLQAHALKPWMRWSGQTAGGGLNQYMFTTCTREVGGVAYDRDSNLLYIVQVSAGFTGDNPFAALPVVHVFRIVE